MNKQDINFSRPQIGYLYVPKENKFVWNCYLIFVRAEFNQDEGPDQITTMTIKVINVTFPQQTEYCTTHVYEHTVHEENMAQNVNHIRVT